MQKVLISSCLLGENVRYDGKAKQRHVAILEQWQVEGRLISICPEVAGGLPVPRPAAEIQGDRVVNRQGVDVSHAFAVGAQKALELCQKHHIHIAILKEGSPSCGVTRIYDGTFQGIHIVGQGITAQLLREHGIDVFHEHQLDKVEALLDSERA
jgi:uncharacterized protein YbbK (DUF523 family)